MEQIDISFDLVGSMLKEDIYSNEGILLLKQGITLKEIHIVTLQKYRFGKSVAVEKARPSAKAISIENQKNYLSTLEQIKEAFHLILKVEMTNVQSILLEYHKLVTSALADVSLLRLLNTEFKPDDHLYQHSMNVGIIAALIGRCLALPKSDWYLLSTMGLFHDIGMLHVDPLMTKKDGPLSSSEYDDVKEHTLFGYGLLRILEPLDPLVHQAARSHHERIDGSGYPSHLKESEIPFFIQIVSVADCFSAMSMKPYGEKKTSFASVFELVNESLGNRLNPSIVVPFIRYIMRQHLYESVTLNNGEVAEIIFIHDDEPHKPLVRMNEKYIDLRRDSSLTIATLI
ncbi:HD-GYP domain-containing protein [Bacillus alkalicellulosilyticus]|uniref:HD-GYP domain-containing protein n=1 Tax=Alkalihalobacterium alkalicellulosilyticum TaxID=1912214 RepID=UPI00099740C7|nr:HD domain-containing phosphohydrolase [Bacillus alkalicellulosilyticus]